MARKNNQIWVKEEKKGWRKFEKGLTNTREYTVLFENLPKLLLASFSVNFQTIVGSFHYLTLVMAIV